MGGVERALRQARIREAVRAGDRVRGTGLSGESVDRPAVGAHSGEIPRTARLRRDLPAERARAAPGRNGAHLGQPRLRGFFGLF